MENDSSVSKSGMKARLAEIVSVWQIVQGPPYTPFTVEKHGYAHVIHVIHLLLFFFFKRYPHDTDTLGNVKLAGQEDPLEFNV